MSEVADAARGAALERRVLAWMCVLIAVNQLGFGGLVPVLPLYAQSFGVSASAIGMAVAVYGLARFFVAMPSGRLSDGLGRRPTLALGGIVSAVGNLWCAYASGYPEFVVARFVAGAGAGLVLTTGHIILADISTPERRGRTLAIYQGVFIFSVGIGPFPGGLLAEHYGLAAPFLAYGIVGVIASAIAWFAVQETRDLKGLPAGALGSARPTFRAQLRLLASKLGFVLVSLIALINAFARTGGLFTIIPVIGSVRLGLSTTQIGIGLALGSIAGVLLAYPAGALVDRFGRKTVIVPATVISGASMVLFCFAPSYGWYVGACVTWGIATSVGGAAPAAYAADSAPAGMNATAMSTFRMVSDFGYVVGPIALGAVVDLHGPNAALLCAAFLLVSIGAVFALLAPETRRPQKSWESTNE